MTTAEVLNKSEIVDLCDVRDGELVLHLRYQRGMKNGSSPMSRQSEMRSLNGTPSLGLFAAYPKFTFWSFRPPSRSHSIWKPQRLRHIVDPLASPSKPSSEHCRATRTWRPILEWRSRIRRRECE